MQSVRQRAQRYEPDAAESLLRRRHREPSPSSSRSKIVPRAAMLFLTIAGLSLAHSPSTFSSRRQLGGAGPLEPDLWWCAAHESALKCTSGGCERDHDACGWPTSSDATLAVLFSDRLEHAANVTLRSACSFEAESPVELLFISTTPQRGLPSKYRACRLLPMLAAEIVQALQSSGGFAPLRVCALNASSALLLPRETLLPRAGSGGRHIKHAMCLNHLRFYMAELPALRAASRVVLLDDDLVVRRPLRALSSLPMAAGMLVAANCDAFRWSRPCIGWAVSHETYAHWFQRTEHGLTGADLASDAPLSRALAAAGQPTPDVAHRVWNFGCTLFNLRAHRRLGMARTFERVAGKLLDDGTLRADSLLYGLGVAYLVYQGRVQCYDSITNHYDSMTNRYESERSLSRRGDIAWFQLDGLGHIPYHELRELVGGDERIEVASVVHYTGERKPWSSLSFDEYAFLLPAEARPPPPPPLSVALIVHDAASEWLALNMSRAIQDDALCCGSFTSIRDRRLEHLLLPVRLVAHGARHLEVVELHQKKGPGLRE